MAGAKYVDAFPFGYREGRLLPDDDENYSTRRDSD